MTRRLAARSQARLGLLVLLAAVAGAAAAVTGEAGHGAPCSPQLDQAYAADVNRTLTERQDVWGNALLRSPDGPTYDGVRNYLHPLMLAGRPAGIRPGQLTDSGVYYLPFGTPAGTNGAKTVQLHVADGSQIVSGKANGRRLSLDVGVKGRERYGSCLARLAPPRLRSGYLPILETHYVDADGVRYQQESFATRLPRTRALISFVRLHVDPRGSHVPSASVRFTPSGGLGRGARKRLLFSRGGKLGRSSLVYSTRGRRPRTVYVAWLDRPVRPRPPAPSRATYKRARRALIVYWGRRLSAAATFVVPEKRVLDAERNLLIQNMLMSWRYSLGNSYERFSWELVDVAEVMGDYGFHGIERAILRASLRSSSHFPNRAAGERMAASAHYYRRFHNRSYLKRVTPVFRRYLAAFDRQVLDPQQPGEARCDPAPLAGVGHELLQRPGKAGADLLFLVSLTDGGPASHHLDQRPVADPLAIGRRAPLVPIRVIDHAVEVLLELPGKPRLADAGLADDGDQPRLALPGGGVELLFEVAQLIVATNERRLQQLAAAASSAHSDDRGRAPGGNCQRFALERLLPGRLEGDRR